MTSAHWDEPGRTAMRAVGLVATAVPSSVRIRLVEPVTFDDSYHDGAWSLRVLAAEPDCGVMILPDARIEPSTPPRG